MTEVHDVAAETTASGNLLLWLLPADDPPVEENGSEANGKTGNNGSHPDLGDGKAGSQSVENTGRAGWNQNAKETGGSCESGSVGFLVAAFCHLFDHDLSDGGERRGGGAGQQTEGLHCGMIAVLGAVKTRIGAGCGRRGRAAGQEDSCRQKEGRSKLRIPGC